MTTLLQRETGYTFDSLLELQASVLKAATFNGAAVDLGAAGAGDNEDGVAIFRADMVIDISTIEIASNDEAYVFILEGSDNTGFTGTDLEELGRLHVGALEVLSVDNDVDSDVGRYVTPVTNHRNTRVYRFVRLTVEIAGTIATGVTYSAFLGKPKNV